MENVRLEVAVDNPHAARAAVRGGAQRLELCASLVDGGLTPSRGLVEWALDSFEVPMHCMVRPRAGNFVYTADELAVMARDIADMRAAGVHGIVTGVLRSHGGIDRGALSRLAEQAYPMGLCVHRAFDLAQDREQALEDAIGCGASILLTSGGATSLGEGASEVARIVSQAAGRIEIMGGAGVNVSNAGHLWRSIPVDTLHGSLRSAWRAGSHAGVHAAQIGARDGESLYTVCEEDVRAVLAQLTPRSQLGDLQPMAAARLLD